MTLVSAQALSSQNLLSFFQSISHSNKSAKKSSCLQILSTSVTAASHRSGKEDTWGHTALQSNVKTPPHGNFPFQVFKMAQTDLFPCNLLSFPRSLDLTGHASR